MHLLLILLFSAGFRGCQRSAPGSAGGEVYREIGLVVSDGVDGGANDSGTVEGQGQDQIDQTEQEGTDARKDSDSGEAAGSVSDRLPAEAPEIASLLDASRSGTGTAVSELPPLIGDGNPIGGSAASRAGGNSRLMQQKEAGGASRIGGTGGPGETSFMDINGIGTSFVYLIDTSASMDDGNRLKIAQSQLKKSLRMLQASQKFAVITYNDEFRHRISLKRQPEKPMYPASELNVRLAIEAIDRIYADRGTEHKPALLEALMLKPDVLYFLTDGLEPELTAADLREIAARSGQTIIHVIQFGDSGMVTRETSWLQRLARQSGGEFREIRTSPR